MDDKLTEIPISSILEPTEQIRTAITMEGLNELAESIKEKGVINPLIVVEKDHQFEISAGHRRYLASKIAGLATVPCIVRAMSVEDADLVKIHENFYREDINPVDEGKFFNRLHEKYNLTLTEIAKKCSRSPGYVSTRVSIIDTDPAVLSALEAGQVNFSQAVELARTQNDNTRQELLRITVESGATTETLRMMRHDYEQRERQGDPAVTAPPPPGQTYQEVKHLIQCPACGGTYDVNQIFPVSVCKTCYDGLLTGLAEGRKEAEKK